MVEVEALRMQHWLMWKPGGSNEVVGCHCGSAADVEADSGYGDSVVVHFFEVAAAAVRAEVANEIRTHAGPLNDRGIRVGVQDWSADRGQGYTSAIGEVLDLLAVDPLSPPEPRLPIPPSV